MRPFGLNNPFMNGFHKRAIKGFMSDCRRSRCLVAGAGGLHDPRKLCIESVRQPAIPLPLEEGEPVLSMSKGLGEGEEFQDLHTHPDPLPFKLRSHFGEVGQGRGSSPKAPTVLLWQSFMRSPLSDARSFARMSAKKRSQGNALNTHRALTEIQN